MAELTQKQQRFVAEYLVDGNGARAAIAAGYGVAGARVRAHRLTRDNKAVMAALEARQAQDSQRLQIERQDAIKGLLEAIQLAKEQANPAAMIAGWKTLATMLGFMEPKRLAVEVSAAADAERGRLERLSDAELMRLMGAGAEGGAAHASQGGGVEVGGGENITSYMCAGKKDYRGKQPPPASTFHQPTLALAGPQSSARDPHEVVGVLALDPGKPLLQVAHEVPQRQRLVAAVLCPSAVAVVGLT